MWSKCKQLCRLRCCAACRRSVPFHSVSFHFVSHSWHPMALQFLLQCKNVFATSEIERQLADAPSSLPSMCGRGPHCSLPVAFYCLLLGVNWETARPTDTFKVPASCQDRSKNYACHRKLFELEDNRPSSPLSQEQLKKRRRKKTAKGFTWFKWQAAASTNGQLGASILLLENWQKNINIYCTTVLFTVFYKLYGK